MFASYIESRNDWDDHLLYMCMTYRSRVHKSKKFSLNRLMLGHEIILSLDVMLRYPPSAKSKQCYVQFVEWVKKATQCSYVVAHKYSTVVRQP